MNQRERILGVLSRQDKSGHVPAASFLHFAPDCHAGLAAGGDGEPLSQARAVVTRAGSPDVDCAARPALTESYGGEVGLGRRLTSPRSEADPSAQPAGCMEEI
jgi:hypothetical protein